jgi:hypothetical protein
VLQVCRYVENGVVKLVVCIVDQIVSFDVILGDVRRTPQVVYHICDYASDPVGEIGCICQDSSDDRTLRGWDWNLDPPFVRIELSRRVQ